ncbi:Integrase core domain protein [Maliponia aquimaris]|uniref:Integrase core domain protein n=1 Tax=Maliponia aquimaris TaxID=1673631 RepID=A0A238L5B4_9RHOB|nr:Integrase core domain protein [Maliponia aquimaris]
MDAAPDWGGDPDHTNPEQAQTPALSSCRMMTFLALAAKAGWPVAGHKIDPYLLRNLSVTHPNHVWAMDITYIPMARGFIYLVAVVDRATRRILAWRVSITLDAGFCIGALEEA